MNRVKQKVQNTRLSQHCTKNKSTKSKWESCCHYYQDITNHQLYLQQSFILLHLWNNLRNPSR